MKKKIFAIIIAIVLVCSFGACKTRNQEMAEAKAAIAAAEAIEASNLGLVVLKSSNEGRIYYDPETRVMYLYIKGSHSEGGLLTAMLNADGSPKLYTPEVEGE